MPFVTLLASVYLRNGLGGYSGLEQGSRDSGGRGRKISPRCHILLERELYSQMLITTFLGLSRRARYFYFGNRAYR
jgi:hypothetical protein